MNLPTLKLNRNLRRHLLQGNPWVYREAIDVPNNLSCASLCKVVDSKNQFVGWGFYSPQSPLALRVLSLQKEAPSERDYSILLQRAWQTRQELLENETNCFRLVNGEGDLLPGVICDIYNKVAVLQFDGQGPYEFWDQEWLANWLLKNSECETVYYKPRHDSKNQSQYWGKDIVGEYVEVKENAINFYVDIIYGQKTGFFLDQRENRNHVKQISPNKSVLNLFSYTGGFSVYAGKGDAGQVTSVDIAQGALDLAEKNWLLNDLPKERHEGQCADVFEYVQATQKKYDIVICDPPSLAKSEKQKEAAIQKYTECFSMAAKRVNKRGHLILSSCSSHISFDDFQEITSTALSRARKRGQILRVSGQGPDHPYPHACPQLRYLKFVDLIVYD